MASSWWDEEGQSGDLDQQKTKGMRGPREGRFNAGRAIETTTTAT